MQVIGFAEKKSDGARQISFSVLDGRFRLVHIHGQVWDMLFDVKSSMTVSDKPALSWIISSPTIRLASDGSVPIIERASLADMIIG